MNQSLFYASILTPILGFGLVACSKSQEHAATTEEIAAMQAELAKLNHANQNAGPTASTKD